MECKPKLNTLINKAFEATKSSTKPKVIKAKSITPKTVKPKSVAPAVIVKQPVQPPGQPTVDIQPSIQLTNQQPSPVVVVQPSIQPTIVQPSPALVVQPSDRPVVVVQPSNRRTIVQPSPVVVVQPSNRPVVVVQPSNRPVVVVQPSNRPQPFQSNQPTIIQPSHCSTIFQPCSVVVVQPAHGPAVVLPSNVVFCGPSRPNHVNVSSKVIEVSSDFCCEKGLTDFNRDLLIRLVGGMGDKRKIKNVVGISQEHHKWMKSRYFKLLRYNYVRDFPKSDYRLTLKSPSIKRVKQNGEWEENEVEVDLKSKILRKKEQNVWFFQVSQENFNAHEQDIFLTAENQNARQMIPRMILTEQ